MADFGYSYLQINFKLARDFMASSPKSLRQRIAGAYREYLLKLGVTEMPEDMRVDFMTLTELLSQQSARHSEEGSVEASLSQMHWSKVHECAKLIVDMATKADNLFFNDPHEPGHQ